MDLWIYSDRIRTCTLQNHMSYQPGALPIVLRSHILCLYKDNILPWKLIIQFNSNKRNILFHSIQTKEIFFFVLSGNRRAGFILFFHSIKTKERFFFFGFSWIRLDSIHSFHSVKTKERKILFWILLNWIRLILFWILLNWIRLIPFHSVKTKERFFIGWFLNRSKAYSSFDSLE